MRGFDKYRVCGNIIKVLEISYFLCAYYHTQHTQYKHFSINHSVGVYCISRSLVWSVDEFTEELEPSGFVDCNRTWNRPFRDIDNLVFYLFINAY